MEDSLQTKISILLFGIIVVILGTAFCYDKGILDDHTSIKRDETDLLIEKDGEIELTRNNAKFYSVYKALEDLTYQTERIDGISSFSYEERMRIVALELRKSDFKKTEKIFNITNGHTNYYYQLKHERVMNILKKYFGSESYINGVDLINDMVTYQLNVSYPEGSKMIITDYDSEKEMYEVRFTGNKKKKDKFIENRKIVSAILKDNVITVVEKAIYYDKEELEDELLVRIYQDREKEKLLEEKLLSSKDLNKKKISIKKYEKEATTITYTFEYDEVGNDYYFVSSKIS